MELLTYQEFVKSTCFTETSSKVICIILSTDESMFIGKCCKSEKDCHDISYLMALKSIKANFEMYSNIIAQKKC